MTTRLQETDKTAWQTWNTNYKKYLQKNHRLGTASKTNTGGLKHVWRRQPRPYFWCGSRLIDVWFAWIYHLLVNTNRGIKRRWNKDKDSTVYTTDYTYSEIFVRVLFLWNFHASQSFWKIYPSNNRKLFCLKISKPHFFLFLIHGQVRDNDNLD